MKKMVLPRDYVRILKGFYKGEVGRVKGFDGFRFVIKLNNKALEVKIPENEFEKISEEQLKKSLIKINFRDNTVGILEDKDFRYTSDYLKTNMHFKGLFALGKYYSKKNFPNEHNSDYLSQQILGIKNFRASAAQEVAIIYKRFIKESEILQKVVSKIDHICFMPNVNYKNHVKQWGNLLCDYLSIQDISYIIKIPDQKKVGLRYYKYKPTWERQKIINGVFFINENRLNLKNNTCLILDDICTTGLQINELTNALVKTGVKEVYAFVIGRTKY